MLAFGLRHGPVEFDQNLTGRNLVAILYMDRRDNSGLERLDRMESRLSSIRNTAVEALQWRVKSELLTKAGRLEESDQALQHILSLGDSARASSARAPPASPCWRRNRPR